MDAIFNAPGNRIDHTPAADVAAGDIIVLGDSSLIGIAHTAIPADALGSLATEGVFLFAQAAGSTLETGDGAFLVVADGEASDDDDTGSNPALGVVYGTHGDLLKIKINA